MSTSGYFVVNRVTQVITDGDTANSPSGDAIFDALALKANAGDLGSYVLKAGDSTTGDITYTGGAGSGAFSTRVSGDSVDRIEVRNTEIAFGPGNAATDVNLYRFGANVLGTDDLMFVTRPNSTDAAFGTKTTADSTTHWGVDADGRIKWGSGTSLEDVFLSRPTLRTLLVSPSTGSVSFWIGAAAAGQTSAMMLATTPLASGARWQFAKDGSAESGGNAGSNFFLQSLTDTGTFLASVLTIIRATGAATFNNSVTAKRSIVSPPSANNNGFSVSSAGTNDLAIFQGLDLAGNTYGFFAINKYFNGGTWVDNGLARVGGSFQLLNDSCTFFSFNTGTTFTARFTIASGGNVQIGTGTTPGSRLTFDASTVASGGILFGTDTNLYRSAADILKTDDKLITVVGLGVGNSAAATTPGAVVRKMEVFDAAGASLGFIPIYSSIT